MRPESRERKKEKLGVFGGGRGDAGREGRREKKEREKENIAINSHELIY